MHAPRFEMDADDLEGATRYLHHRALQILADGFSPLSVEPIDEEGTRWSVRARCRDASGRIFQSIYVLASQRSRGHMSRYLRATDVPIVTTPDCNLEEFLRRKGVEYCVAGRFTECHEYRMVQDFYGDRRARRSGLCYMNHIDEGLAVLAHIGASDRARRAFCLHPLLQADADLRQNFSRSAALTPDPQVLALALEYRNIANGYLSPMGPRRPSEIRLGPLRDVHDMLRADKVQNYKDFLLMHLESHPRSDALDRYFRSWLSRLEVDATTFGLLFERLQCDPTPRSLSALGIRGL